MVDRLRPFGPLDQRPRREPPEAPARLDAVALVFAILLPPAAAWLYLDVFADAVLMPILYTSCKVAQFSFPVVWILLVQRERLPRPARSAQGLGAGFWSGGALFALIWGIYLVGIRGSDLLASAAPRITARIEVMGAGTPVRFLALTLFLSVIHSFLEEYYWRWFVFGRLRRYFAQTSALVLSSLAFTAHHVIVLHAFVGFGRFWWATFLLSLAVPLGGGLWAWLYARSGSLYAPWLSHMMVDLGIMTMGYDVAWGVG